MLAPWPFLIFCAIAVASTFVATYHFGWVRGIMLGFDVAALVFALCCVHLFGFEAREMREAAKRNDANRGLLLLVASVVTIVIMISVASELSHKGRPQLFDLVLVIATLCLSWAFSTLVYTLHYAHLFYSSDAAGKDRGGICFPETKEPDYWDFAYFSSCLAMTFQTSDVDITSRSVRRIVMFHCLGAFVFNLGVIAFSINILGSS